MTRDEALAARDTLLETVNAGIKYAQALTKEHNLPAFSLDNQTTSGSSRYKVNLEISDGYIEAWVDSSYVYESDNNWNSSSQDC